MLLGKEKDTDTRPANVSINNDCIRCLGIYVGLNKKEVNQRNWNDTISKMENTLSNWRSRHLSIIGKITVLKSLIIPKLVFVTTNTSIPSTEIIKYVNRLLYNFI